MTCDYGQQVNNLFVYRDGIRQTRECAWREWQGGGTTAVFECIAPPAPGTYQYDCVVETGPGLDNMCPASNLIGNLIVRGGGSGGYCGDGIPFNSGGEECDDRNGINVTSKDGDTCNNRCELTPKCSSAAIISQTSNSVTVQVYGVQNTLDVRFPTWSDINGQDDLDWSHRGVNKGGGVWEAVIDLSRHRPGNPDYGTFYVHPYVLDRRGQAVTPTCEALSFERIRPPVCGDSFLDSGEECDDGNTISGDGCSSTCTRECSLTVTYRDGTSISGRVNLHEAAPSADLRATIIPPVPIRWIVRDASLLTVSPRTGRDVTVTARNFEFSAKNTSVTAENANVPACKFRVPITLSRKPLPPWHEVFPR